MKKLFAILALLAIIIFSVINTSPKEVHIPEIVEQPVAEKDVTLAAPIIERGNSNDLINVNVVVTGNKFQGLDKLRVILTNQSDIAKQFDFHDKPSWDYLLEVGEWEIKVTAKDYMPHTELFSVTKDTTEFQVELSGAAHITGIINDSFGNPLNRQYIFFLTAEQSHPQRGDDYRKEMFYVRSKANGRFQSPALPAGEYYISAGRPRTPGLRSSTSVTLLQFEWRQAKIVVGDSTLLRIVPNGELTKQITLALEEYDTEQNERHQRRDPDDEEIKERWEKTERVKNSDANEDGEFMFTDLRVGKYRLIVEAGRQKYLLETNIELQASQPVTLRFDVPPIVERVKLTADERAEKQRLRKEQRELGIKPEKGPKYLPLTATIVSPDFESNLMVESGIFWE
ncbi:MAG: carboxypeptidase regulatory-like domain-containing protein [Planctomycetes bacterium]|nr:carboxypeptidase regulatory-like domain-containing protein [Planctomycetota bacterium]